MALPLDVGVPARASGSAPSDGPRRVRPVLVWAGLGVLGLAVAAWSFASWWLSGRARPAPVGSDPVPAVTLAWGTVFQVAGPILAVAVVGVVVRRCWRERRLTLDAMILVGTATAWWHDPLINWVRPFVFYSATMSNAGSWSEDIPGWIAPNGRYLAEPPLMIGLAYVWMALLFGMLATAAMRAARRRWPRLAAPATFAVGWIAVLGLELPLETLAVHSGLVGYPSAIPALTLWAGQTVQVPVYGPVLWSCVLAGIGALRFFLDAHGRSVAERGIERVAGPRRLRTLLCTLAVVGFVHVSAVVGYDLPINIAGSYAGPAPLYPSHLRTLQCGPGTPVGCPGPDTPAPVGG